MKKTPNIQSAQYLLLDVKHPPLFSAKLQTKPPLTTRLFALSQLFVSPILHVICIYDFGCSAPPLNIPQIL